MSQKLTHNITNTSLLFLKKYIILKITENKEPTVQMNAQKQIKNVKNDYFTILTQCQWLHFSNDTEYCQTTYIKYIHVMNLMRNKYYSYLSKPDKQFLDSNIVEVRLTINRKKSGDYTRVKTQRICREIYLYSYV